MFFLGVSFWSASVLNMIWRGLLISPHMVAYAFTDHVMHHILFNSIINLQLMITLQCS
jgi:hypothetical protein